MKRTILSLKFNEIVFIIEKKLKNNHFLFKVAKKKKIQFYFNRKIINYFLAAKKKSDLERVLLLFIKNKITIVNRVLQTSTNSKINEMKS